MGSWRASRTPTCSRRSKLIRGANGLLTGVGNASGTINYVRKRPTNKDGGEALVTLRVLWPRSAWRWTTTRC